MLTKIRYGSEEEYSQLLLASKNEKKVKQKKRYDAVLLSVLNFVVVTVISY